MLPEGIIARKEEEAWKKFTFGGCLFNLFFCWTARRNISPNRNLRKIKAWVSSKPDKHRKETKTGELSSRSYFLNLFHCLFSGGEDTRFLLTTLLNRIGHSTFHWSVFDWQVCVKYCCTAKWFSYMCVYILFLNIFFSIVTVYHGILNIVLCALEQDLVAYPFCIWKFIFAGPNFPLHPSPSPSSLATWVCSVST